tara:strand:+ start:47 stop:256 length:210 start_codon:yes stop_codon:yes gene_type:complete
MNKNEMKKVMLFKALGIIFLAGGLVSKFYFNGGVEIFAYAILGAVLYVYATILVVKAQRRAKREREASN